MANFTSSPSVGDEIAKGVNRYRFNGVGWTPVSRSPVAGSLAVTQMKWEFKLTAGQTSITGTDSNGLLLDYDTNAEVEVFYNGIKIVEGSSEDYVLTSSSVLTIVGSGVKLNDEVEIVQRSRFTAADYYEKTELDTSLAGKVDDAQVLTNVPTGAVFTDTVYSKPINEPISYVTGLQTALDGKIDDSQVLTNVPSGAVFTDTNTVYSHPSTHPISKISGLQTALDGKTTESYVNTQIGAVVGAATPATLNTLQELGDALGDDANFAGTMTTALAGKVDDAQVLTNVPSGAVFTDTNTTYSVGDGGLTQKNFTTTLKSKLDGVASSANNYTHPSAHSISEVTNLQTELDDIETLALAGL